MSAEARIDLLPITPADVPRVAAFLHNHLNALPGGGWSAAINAANPGGADASPNHGFMLCIANQVVGANLAFYSTRTVDSQTRRFCNLAALCVREDVRPHALRLIRALLQQRDVTFTDFSPSGNVVAMNERLGFVLLDPATYLIANLPLPPSRRVEVIADLDRMAELLEGEDRRVFDGHREAQGVRQLLLRVGDRNCHVLFRVDRRKRLRIFASLIHVGDPWLYRHHGRHLARHLIHRHHAIFTLAERRVIGGPPRGLFRLITGRPKMVKTRTIAPESVDYLYSELTYVPW